MSLSVLQSANKAVVVAFGTALKPLFMLANDFHYGRFDPILQNATPDNVAKHEDLFAAKDWIEQQVTASRPMFVELVKAVGRLRGVTVEDAAIPDRIDFIASYFKMEFADFVKEANQ